MQSKKSTLSELRVRIILGLVGMLAVAVLAAIGMTLELLSEGGFFKIILVLMFFALTVIFKPTESLKLLDPIVGIFVSKKK